MNKRQKHQLQKQISTEGGQLSYTKATSRNNSVTYKIMHNNKMQRNNTKSCRPATAEKTELSRLNKEGTQQLKEEI